MTELLPILWTAIATVGFAVRFGLRGRDLVPTSAGAVAGWLVFDMVSKASGPAQGYFVAALAIGIYAEVLAALQKKPATIYVVTAIFPLVPGGGMYYTMLHSVRGELWLAIASGYDTLTAAGAIAAGLAVSSALSRLVSLRSIARRLADQPPRPPRRPRLPTGGRGQGDAGERDSFESREGGSGEGWRD